MIALPALGAILGASVFALALWLLWRAHADLGNGTRDEDLVTHGVYGSIRHPVYAALWLWGLAQVLLLPNAVAGFAGLACFLPIYLVRVPREEQRMLDRFGRKYRDYMARTGRIVPLSLP
jgi:protein-S-isoprenylcysteine O-methyltransferase Ste14